MKEEKYIAGRDCSCCDFFYELPGKLGTDFGFCNREESEVYYQVLFEHFRCRAAKKREE